MFEKNLHIPEASPAPASTARFGADAGAHGVAQEALMRPIDWTELTARLNAARDLRRVLRKGSGGRVDEFADAAARFLNGRDEHQTDVNLVGLGRSKGSQSITFGVSIENDKTARKLGHTANFGDAREN